MRVLVADAQPLFRVGVHAVLSQQLGFEVVGEAADTEEAVALVSTTRPDVILADSKLPPSGAVQLLAGLDLTVDGPRVLLLCPDCGPQEIEAALEAGARGVVSRDVSAAALVKAIRSVAAGEYWLGRGDASEIVRRLRERIAAPPRQPSADDGLTARERAIVVAVAAGQSNRAVSQQLGIAEDTVKHHLTDVFDKLGVANRAELAAWAARRGLSAHR